MDNRSLTGIASSKFDFVYVHSLYGIYSLHHTDNGVIGDIIPLYHI